jgi:hypothetical protein
MDFFGNPRDYFQYYVLKKIYNGKLKHINIIVIKYLLLHDDKRFILSLFKSWVTF